MNKIFTRLEEKKRLIDAHRPLPPELVQNLDEWFRIELTYTSNAIEGNTLTRQETALVVEKGTTVEGKTLVEHLEAVNHAKALQLMKSWQQKTRGDILEKQILDIHGTLLHTIDDRNAGRYRTVPVRIAGSMVVMPNPLKVPTLMKEFMTWLHSKMTGHPVKIAADAHLKLVTIHPFTDGNGRMARLLMNLLLLQTGYTPALITKESRRVYINSIEQAQLHQQRDDYYRVIVDAVERSLDIYLEALEEPEVQVRPRKGKLLKIGELAKAAGESVPTIRFWTQEGLLRAVQTTPGGYQLFASEMVKKIAEIRHLQKKERLTIRELKDRFLPHR